MRPARTYLDHNATTPLRAEARAAALAALEAVGNPSSVHAEGRRARAIIETAREQVARLVNAKPLEVVFTSGATEANNWVIGGGYQQIVCAAQEHHSVFEPARNSGATLFELASDRSGVVDLEALRAPKGFKWSERCLLSLQMANSETGVMQPLGDAVALLPKNAHVHTDATQAAGRVPVELQALGVDFLSLSSHKLGGPTGVGALVIRDGARLASLITGGGQERRRRAGTENVVGIAGFGAAAAAAAEGLGDMNTRVRALRNGLERGIKSLTPHAVVIGDEAERLPNTTSVAVRGMKAETLVIKLDLMGIAVSAGAACSSGKVGASHVLAAMGLAPEIAGSAIRLSLGWNSSEADVDAFLRAWREIAGTRVARAVA